MTFIIIRAASFHQIDHLLGLSIVGFKVNWLLELGGIACIAIAAINHRNFYLKQK